MLGTDFDINFGIHFFVVCLAPNSVPKPAARVEALEGPRWLLLPPLLKGTPGRKSWPDPISKGTSSTPQFKFETKSQDAKLLHRKRRCWTWVVTPLNFGAKLTLPTWTRCPLSLTGHPALSVFGGDSLSRKSLWRSYIYKATPTNLMPTANKNQHLENEFIWQSNVRTASGFIDGD